MIIDAKDTILGRLGTYVAKQVLLGKKVDVINCEESVVSGKKLPTIQLYLKKLHRGTVKRGPFFYRQPHMFVKRTIRGMLPFKIARGRNAFVNIKCHIGIPKNLENEKVMTIKGIGIDKLENANYLKVKDICKAMDRK